MIVWSFVSKMILATARAILRKKTNLKKKFQRFSKTNFLVRCSNFSKILSDILRLFLKMILTADRAILKKISKISKFLKNPQKFSKTKILPKCFEITQKFSQVHCSTKQKCFNQATNKLFITLIPHLPLFPPSPPYFPLSLSLSFCSLSLSLSFCSLSLSTLYFSPLSSFSSLFFFLFFSLSLSISFSLSIYKFSLFFSFIILSLSLSLSISLYSLLMFFSISLLLFPLYFPSLSLSISLSCFPLLSFLLFLSSPFPLFFLSFPFLFPLFHQSCCSVSSICLPVYPISHLSSPSEFLFPFATLFTLFPSPSHFFLCSISLLDFLLFCFSFS